MTQVRCESCSQIIQVTDINLERMVARCCHCNGLFDVSAQWAEVAYKPKIAPPQGFLRQQRGAQVTISWRWFRLSTLYETLVCVALTGFLISFYHSMLSSPNPPGFALLFPLIPICFGGTLFYKVLCSYFNRTRVRFDSSRVEIIQGPLPHPQHQSSRLAGTDLEQIFLVEKRNPRGDHGYQVHALLKNGSRIKLLSDLEVERAFYLKQEIVGHLGLIQRPVPGEYRH